MGRFGFKTDQSSIGEEQQHQQQPQQPQQLGMKEDGGGLSDGSISLGTSDQSGGIRDTVYIIKELCDTEGYEGAPIGN